MNILNIAYYTLLRGFRDRKSMLNMILLPIVLIVILGSALNNVYKFNDVTAINITYLNSDDGVIGKSFDEFINSNDLKNYITVIKKESIEDGKASIKNNEARAFIYLAPDISKKVEKGEKIDIEIYSDSSSNELASSIVNNIIDSYVNGANTMQAVMKLNPQAQYRQIGESVKTQPITSEGKVPRALDYYAVTMLVMTLMYGSQYGLHGISEDYLEEMKFRLRNTPVRISSHFIGKLLGLFVLVFLQGFALLLFSKYAYGANWGTKPFELVVITATLTAFSISLGAMVTMIIRERRLASSVLSTVIPLVTFASGGYVKIVSDSQSYKLLSCILPNKLGHTAFFTAIYGDCQSEVYVSLLILWAMTALMGIVAVIFGRRKLS